MQVCEKCRITVRGSKRRCPLCGNDLAGEPAQETAGYSALQIKTSKWSFIKLMTFMVIVLEITMVAVNYLTGGTQPWIVFVMVWAPIALLDMLIVSYYRHNGLKLLTWQVYIGMAVCVIVDRKMAGWHAWSITWMLPCTFVGLALVTIIIGRAMRMMLMEYIIYLAVAVVFSLIQLLFIHIGWNPFPFPAVISVVVMLILGVAGLLFFFRELRSAASRMFHM